MEREGEREREDGIGRQGCMLLTLRQRGTDRGEEGEGGKGRRERHRGMEREGREREDGIGRQGCVLLTLRAMWYDTIMWFQRRTPSLSYKSSTTTLANQMGVLLIRNSWSDNDSSNRHRLMPLFTPNLCVTNKP